MGVGCQKRQVFAKCYGRHSVWMTHVPRAQRRWQAHCRARSRWMCQRRAGRRSASGQCLKHHIQLLTCKRVYPRESMCTAGEARTHGACVTSVLCTRVLVCKAQGSERGRGGGEAEASQAWCSTCLEIGKSGNRETGKPGKPRRAHTTFYVRRSRRLRRILNI